jgi:uncharacterized membrane protein YgcG
MAAQFVDFAVRRMVQGEDRGTEVSAAMRYALRLRSPAGATEDEGKVLRVLFGKELEPGKGRVLGKLSAHGKSLLAGLADPKDRARESGLRRTTPAGPARAFRSVAGGVALLLTLLGVLAAFAGALHPLLVVEILAAWVVWAVTAGFSSRRDALTDAGADLRDHLLGMRDYLALAEEDRFRMLQSPVGALRVDGPGKSDVVRLYERLLPYAILWNVEDQWVEVLRARYADTGAENEWFVSRSPLASLDLHGFASSASAATHPPSTSSGSSSYSGSGMSSSFGGSSGGGFSGGGGGGGGGGGR